MTMDDMVKEAKNVSPGIIAGDFNTSPVEKGSAYPREECLLNAFATLEVILLNNGHNDTFTRNGRCSKINQIFVSDYLATSSIWRVPGYHF